MKKLLFILSAVSLSMTACSPVLFQQIATLSSENVKLSNDGTFAYEDAMMTIEYDFWSENGEFVFVITNNTDDDIYLNIAESYFINNGYAHDYYQGRTYVYTSKNMASSSSSASAAVAGHAGVSVGTAAQGITGGIYGISGSLGASKGYGASNSVALASERGVSVEFLEQPVVCIPAHSYKAFTEFNVASSVFRECGFVRDPSKKETSIREYTDYSSPKVIENRLVFKIGDITIPVTNVFYVSQYQNISYDDATEYIKVENCDGTKRDVKVHKMSANNKFYITYSKNDMWSTYGNATDRKSTSIVKSSKRKFSDGIYK